MTSSSQESADGDCFAVIFTSQRSEAEGYEELAQSMRALAEQQPGFLGMESVRDASGRGITISYWASREAIANWQAHPNHRLAQQAGRERLYDAYEVRVCRVERRYGFDRGGEGDSG